MMRFGRVLGGVCPAAEDGRYSRLLADSKEYREGEAASHRDLTTRDNPYRFLSPEYWRWQEGLLGNCSEETDVEQDTVDLAACDSRREDESAVVILRQEAVESGAVLAGVS